MSESTESQTLGGSCLCGAVRFEVLGRPPRVGFCHCSICRKATGSAAEAVMTVPKERFRWLEGDDRLQVYRRASGWSATFCPTCGCPAPQPTPDGASVWVPAGALDGDPGPRVSGHIFVGSKASWDAIGDDGAQFDEFPPAR